MAIQELKDFGRSTGCLVAFCDIDRSDPEKGWDWPKTCPGSRA